MLGRRSGFLLGLGNLFWGRLLLNFGRVDWDRGIPQFCTSVKLWWKKPPFQVVSNSGRTMSLSPWFGNLEFTTNLIPFIPIVSPLFTQDLSYVFFFNGGEHSLFPLFTTPPHFDRWVAQASTLHNYLAKSAGATCGLEYFASTGRLWLKISGGMYSGWWFQILFIFAPTWENDPIWLIFFNWVETTN